MRTGGRDVPDAAGDFSKNYRMSDVFQVATGPLVAENESAKTFPVDLSVFLKNIPAEFLDDRRMGLLTRAHDVPGDFVRVDHGDTGLLEKTGDGGLARRDASRQPDQKDIFGDAFMEKGDGGVLPFLVHHRLPKIVDEVFFAEFRLRRGDRFILRGRSRLFLLFLAGLRPSGFFSRGQAAPPWC